MGCRVETLARIVCLSTVFFVPVAHIGTGEDEQTPSLFDQVRDGFKKLKPGMTFDEAKRVLTINKLKSVRFTASNSSAHYYYELRGNSSRTLMVFIRWEKNRHDPVIIDAELRDGEKVIAQFSAYKN